MEAVALRSLQGYFIGKKRPKVLPTIIDADFFTNKVNPKNPQENDLLRPAC